MQNEYVIESLQKKEDVSRILQYAKSISNNCQRLTVQFLNIIKNNRQVARQTVYQELINNNFSYRKQITGSGVCAKILAVKSYAFRCLQCQNQDNSIICIQCFNKSDHKGHPYSKIQVHGGCCDCGDDEKWKAEGSCTDHRQKITEVPINAAETELFIKQMQYFLQLPFIIQFFPTITWHKQHISQILIAFVKFLTKFNEKSVISNEMTYLLFKSQFKNSLKIKQKETYYQLKITVVSYLFRFYKEKQFSRILIDLFITMFARYNFRKYLTIQYNKAVCKKPHILKSELSNISCQIYTSHRVISQVIESRQFGPVCISILEGEKFDSVAEIYTRLYLDLVYLSNLYNNVGEKYMNYHFMEGNITHISGYEQYVRVDPQLSTQYYGIQYILFLRYIELLKYMPSNPNVLAKAIKDLVHYLKQQPTNLNMSLYITNQRSLILLLFIFFKGNIEKATSLEFLQHIGLSYTQIYRMLQAVLFVVRFYAVNLANRQTVERFYTFFSFSLNKKPRILVSLDFQLLKFCLLSLMHFINQTTFEEEEQKQCYYEKIQTFQQNEMPLRQLLAHPIKLIYNVIHEKVSLGEDGAYDRRKAFSAFTDYIGLLHEAIISDDSQLCLKIAFRFNKSKELEKELISFYGSLLKNLECIKFEEFKQICKIFLYQEQVILEKFVREYCIIENKKIKLKNENQEDFQSFNLSYLKSKKCCQPLIPYLSQNEKKNPYQKMPTNLKNKIASNKLKRAIFNNHLIQQICRVTRMCLQTFQSYPQIVQKDLLHFTLFIQELLKLNYTLKSEQIKKLLQYVKDNVEIFKKFPENVKRQIVKTIGYMGQQGQMKNEKEQPPMQKESKKSKMQELRAKKLEKMKSKQQKAVQNFIVQKSGEMINEADESSAFCMFCKNETQEPLSILCFGQKSNMFGKSYLGCRRVIKMLTTCNHFVHRSCNKAINNSRVYIYCNFCKTSCNELLQINEESERIQSQISIGSHEKDGEKIELIASSILFGIFNDYQFFTRNLSKVCCYMLRGLARSTINIDNLVQELNYEKEYSDINQTTSLCWSAYKFTILSTASMLALQRQNSNPDWDIRKLQQQLPQELVDKISSILSSIRAMKFMKNLDQIKITPYYPAMIRKLPTQLKELQCEIGNCPNCSRVTNEIALCMLCQFKSCVGCSKLNLTNHARQQHGSATIFIRVDEGWLIYVTESKNRIMDSLYVNFMGEHFSLQKGQRKLMREDYKLEMNIYNKAKNDLIRHRVEQEIRYVELNTSRVSEIIP